ncbi:MAG: aldo/keto reductase [Eubacteriales bacterium]|nr:aldo/keto reductase [Eubacteriales bacterium]
MHYRLIPTTELNASVISFGGNSLSEVNAQQFAFDQLDIYTEAGGNFIDTANIYGRWLDPGLNHSEIYIGNWLAARRNRHQIVLATKGAHPSWETLAVPRLSRDEVAVDLHQSLAALRTDYIDLYYLHRDDERVSVEEILGYLNDFVKAGKIRYFGCSNWKPARIQEALAIAKARGWHSFVANQLMWSLAEASPAGFPDPTMVAMDKDNLALHRDSNLAAVAYSSQANGYFDKLEHLGKAKISPALLKLYDSPKNDRRAIRVRQIAGEMGLPVHEVVLGYLLAQSIPTYPIIGARDADQLQSSLKAADRRWPDDLAVRLEADD